MYRKPDRFSQNNSRVNFLQYFFFLICIVFLVRLFSIQIVQPDNFKAQAQEQYWDAVTVPAKRGDILSSDGYALATTQVSYLLFVEPNRIKDKNKTADALAKELAEMNKLELEDPFTFYHEKLVVLLAKDLYWAKVLSDLTPEEKKQLENLNLEGIGFEEEPLRYYPEHSLASHILGFVASDENGNTQGYFGVEGSLDGDLTGKPGRIVEERDALGAPILVGGYTRVDSINGRNIVLTIDRGVQYLVEEHLEKGVKEYDAVSGSVIVMDPLTGDIIALANYPTYDPANFNDFEKSDLNKAKRKDIERTNLAISQTYEPGSVIKALTVSAGIDLNRVTPSSTFVDSGPVQYSDYVINNWDGSHHGVQTVEQLLQKSNNIGAAWVGHLVGAKDLNDYFEKFGLGSRTGIDLEGEDTGVIRPYAGWTDIDLATAAFGQGISATPLQVVNSFSAIANGGNLMRPRIVQKVVDEGKDITIPIKVINRVITEETSATMVELLTSAVEGGESKYFNIKNYKIAGKTGTAQIPVNGKYDPSKTNTTFVGFLSESKKFAMIVKLEEPEASIHAAETAVPLWMSIADDLVKYYGIAPDKFVEEAPVVESTSSSSLD